MNDEAQSMPVIRIGSNGPDVERWQKAVGATADGLFGPGTETKTRAWQAAHGLEVDGVVGPRSWAAALDDVPAVPHIADAKSLDATCSGVDLSVFQSPGLFDYEKFRTSGGAFIIARATYGTAPDSAFVEHVRRAKATGLAVGSYAFFRQTQPMQQQFDALCAALDAAGMGCGDIVPAIDLETNSSGADGALNPGAHNTAGRAFVEAVAERFGEAIVYLSPGHWIQIGKPGWVEQHAVWVADWSRLPTPRWPFDGSWAIWQSSASWQSPAFARGPLDHDIAKRLPRIA